MQIYKESLDRQVEKLIFIDPKLLFYETHITAYTFSLLLLFCSISLLASFPNNSRLSLIAAGISFIGFLLNIIVFLDLTAKK